MTEQPLLSPPDEPIEAPTGASQPPPRRSVLPWFYGLGFIVLAAAILYVWQYPNVPNETPVEMAALQTVQQRLADIETRLGRLEQRPTADVGKIMARLDAVDGRIVDQTRLATQLDTISGRIDALARREQTGLDANKQQLDALSARVVALEPNAGNLDAVTKRLNRIARLQEASFALASGRPLGDLPDAPEALARFAHAAPPTEADLRLRFPKAKQTALAAKQPDQSNVPLMNRVWEQAQGLITVRQGAEVVVGNVSAVTLNRAQTALDAGDLADAVSDIETLKGPPAQAMADWLTDAKALLSARSVLTQMADQA